MRVEQFDSNGDRVVPAIASGPEAPLTVDQDFRLRVAASIDASGAPVSAIPPSVAESRATVWHSKTGTATTTPTALHTAVGLADALVRKLSFVNGADSTADLLVGPSDSNATLPPISPGTGIDVTVDSGMVFLLSNWLVSSDAGTASFSIFYLQ